MRAGFSQVSLMGVSVCVLALGISAQASAQDVSGNVGLVSDYRFRGVSLSDEIFAIQGGLDADFGNGFAVGTWASSIDQIGNSEVELDLYANYSGEVENFSYGVGAILYLYPGSEDTSYYEFLAHVGMNTGMIANEVGIAWAPEQDNLNDEDNFYVYYSAEAPLGESGFSLIGGVGYESGAFGDIDGDGDDKIDWHLGVGAAAFGVDWSLTYIDTSEDDDLSDETIVLSLTKSL